MLFTVSLSWRISPCALTSIVFERSPRATAVVLTERMQQQSAFDWASRMSRKGDVHNGDRSDLSGKVGSHQVDVVREVFPNSLDVLDDGLERTKIQSSVSALLGTQFERNRRTCPPSSPKVPTSLATLSKNEQDRSQ